MKISSIRSRIRRASRQGVALIIVLMFIALMLVLIVAFLSQSTIDRQISSASSSLMKADLLCNSAADTIVGDLRQEIATGSISQSVWTNINGVESYIYRPKVPVAAMPSPVVPAGSDITKLPNLLKQSTRGKAFYPATYDSGAKTRAAAVASTQPSANGRYMSAARWNKHLLLPKNLSASPGDTTPVSDFIVPDWILVSRDGSNPTAFGSTLSNKENSNAKYVVGRYAYAIYNTGGLLDINAAGGPALAGMSAEQQRVWRRKGALAFTDLTALPGLSDLSPVRAQQIVDAIVGWRHYATAQPDGAFPSLRFTPAAVQRYLDSMLTTSTQSMAAGNTAPFNGQSDQLFYNRQQLIYLLQGLSQNDTERVAMHKLLQYLSTFNRSLNQPSFQPHPSRPKVTGPAYPGSGTTYSGGNSAFGYEDTFNPAFRKIRVITAFTRNDGSPAVVGEPLVKKRFALSRLSWLTCKGPSAELYAANPSDPVITEMLNQGVPLEVIQEGTGVVGGDFKNGNIYKYFGLKWNAGAGPDGLGGYWTYHHGITSSNATIIGSLEVVAAQNREPDFFELLKAGINAGSVAKGSTAIGSHAYNSDYTDLKSETRVDYQIFAIGANILCQTPPDNFGRSLVVFDGTYNQTFWGATDLPLLYGLTNMAVLVRKASPAAIPNDAPVTPGVMSVSSSNMTWTSPNDPGQIAAFQIPIIWNAHSPGFATIPAALAPSAMRICFSKVAVRSPALISSSPNSFLSVFYPQYRLTPGDSNKTSPSGSSSNFIINPTFGGTYNAARGIIDMPAETAAGNNALMFDNNTALYREPTPLLRAGIPTGSNLKINAQNLMVTSGAATWTEGIPELDSGNKYIGFYYGKFDQRFNLVNTTSPLTFSTYTVNVLGTQTNGNAGTVSFEYKVGNVWVPYRQFGANPGLSPSSVPYTTGGTTEFSRSAILNWRNTSTFARSAAMLWDPRTYRWGAPADMYLGNFLDVPTPATNPVAGRNVMATHWATASLKDNTHGFALGGTAKDMNVSRIFAPFTDGAAYVTDADTIIRRPTGCYGNATTMMGMPLATVQGVTGNPHASNRPIILHRPFRSVAELGYVFRDSPWKNLDFFNPESGDAALLDVFCINDDRRPNAVVAGRVDLNGRQKEVFKTILTGICRDELESGAPLSATEADAIAQALLNRTASTAVNKGPLMNISEIVGRYVPDYTNPAIFNQPYDGFSADLSIYTGAATTTANNTVQRLRETAIRALADTGTAGTWNLMIDVVAQSGRYPSGASGLADFMVEGERRYWVHISIDRSTGQIIDKNVEVVNE